MSTTEHGQKTSKISKISGVFRIPHGFSVKNIVVTILILIGGGGGLAGAGAFDYCTRSDIKEAVGEVVAKEDVRHEVIDNKLADQGSQIERVKTVVDSVQTTQIREIARKEARRITGNIKDREKREQLYDRILYKNIRRLEKGDDPCSDILCAGIKH